MATRFLSSGTEIETKDGRKGFVLEYKSQQEVVINIPSKGMWPFPTILTVARKELKTIEPEYEDAPF